MRNKGGGNRTNFVLKSIKSNWILYVMLIPAIIWYLIFCYAPMGGVLLAFKNYQSNRGLEAHGSEYSILRRCFQIRISGEQLLIR